MRASRSRSPLRRVLVLLQKYYVSDLRGGGEVMAVGRTWVAP